MATQATGSTTTPEDLDYLRKRLDLEQRIYSLTEQRFQKLLAINGEVTAQENSLKAMAQRYEEETKNIFALEKQIIEEKKKGADADLSIISSKEKQLEAAKEANKEAIKKFELETKAYEQLLRIQTVETNRNEMVKRERNLRFEITEGLKAQVGQTLGLSNMTDNLMKGMKLGPAILIQMYENAKQLMDTVIKGNTEFAKTTGQIADRSLQFGYGASQFGVGFEKLNKSSMELFVSMNNFSNQTRAVQENLVLSAAKMELFGVSATVTGKNLEVMTLGLKMTANEAVRVNDQLAKAAIGAGIAPKKMLEEFATNMPKLAAYGKNAVNVYIDLQKAAKSLGMELQSLNSVIGDQFDTFEDSARAAGRFNAVLGGNYLNSVEMLNATESERILLLKKSFDESGKNFDALSKYEKKAVAATLGIQDLNEASKLFGKTTSDLTIDMNKQEASQAKLEETQRQAAEVVDQLREIFNSFLIAIRFIVTIVKGAIDIFTRFNDYLKGVPAVLLGVVAAILSLTTAIATVMVAIESFPAVAAIFQATSKILMLGAYGISAAWNFMAASLGRTVIILGLIATAFWLIHEYLVKPHSPPLYIVLGMMAAIFLAMGLAAQFAEKPLLLLGVAFMLIGLGVGIATAGMSLFINSVSGLLKVISLENVALLYAMSAAIAALSGSLMLMTFAMPGMAVLAYGLLAIGMALRSIPDDKTIALSTINETLTTAKTITEDNIKPTTDFVRTIKDYYEVQATSKEADKDALVNALREINAAIGAANTKKESTQVKLVISGTELANALKSGNTTVNALLHGLS